MGKARSLVPVAFDNGNGFSKIKVQGIPVKLPSALVEFYGDTVLKNVNPDAGSFIEYKDGPRADLIGTKWLTGFAAQSEQPLLHSRVVDMPDGKVRYGLQLLLGALGTVEIPTLLPIACVSSINNSTAWGDKLDKTLKGEHHIIVNGDRPMIVTISNKTFEEGMGVVGHVIARKLSKVDDTIGVLDIGNGTTIACVYRDADIVDGSRKVNPIGVDDLASTISKSRDTLLKFGHVAKNHLILKGIENGSFMYGTTGWNFESVYKQELGNWVKSALAMAMKNIYQWKDSCNAIYACGGGAAMPHIKEALEKEGLIVLVDPQWCNAEGLYKIAEAIK